MNILWILLGEKRVLGGNLSHRNYEGHLVINGAYVLDHNHILLEDLIVNLKNNLPQRSDNSGYAVRSRSPKPLRASHTPQMLSETLCPRKTKRMGDKTLKRKRCLHVKSRCSQPSKKRDVQKGETLTTHDIMLFI